MSSRKKVADLLVKLFEAMQEANLVASIGTLSNSKGAGLFIICRTHSREEAEAGLVAIANGDSLNEEKMKELFHGKKAPTKAETIH